ncbi:alanine racemase [Virgibacillus proomii]|uniref:alanine racemase n=1 Tax=Virgibacillus proomii TaxID=84407 RepID=UPI001C11F5C1|nr:alanine racemase [Virgibacillus proomii]MBU5266655.1 alanine racemase [Virgibacillus proomii]
MKKVDLKVKPRLILHLNNLDENCKKIAGNANGKTIRLATKSIRSIPVLRRILASSPVFQGLMCYCSQEALFLHKQGFNDILIGYPSLDKEAIINIARANKNGAKIIYMVDHIQQLEALQSIAKEHDGLIYTCLDIDMSVKIAGFHFGVRRSPLKHVEEVLTLAAYVKKQSHLRMLGVMGYEAQIAGVPDQLPQKIGVNKVVQLLKKRSLSIVKKRRYDIVQALTAAGYSLELVNGGGTGSLQTTAKEDVITEITVGSGFYAPILFDYFQERIETNASLFFTLPIVRKPAENIYTCLGGGYIASGSAGNSKLPQPVYPKGSKLIPVEGAGEVQTPVYIRSRHIKIGDIIVFRAAKAGEICERFTEIVCVSNGKIVDYYPTYRGEGECFF